MKVDNADAAGALGVVIGNNQPGQVSPGGVSDLPGFAVVQADGTRVKSVDGPVTMTVERLEDPNATDDSHRWLSGEVGPRSAGRSATCGTRTATATPDKVTDEEYHCAVSDGGGVHSNSGVVNHTYAILVEAAVQRRQRAWRSASTRRPIYYWHTQTGYQTPIADFADHADALEVSCGELIGEPLRRSRGSADGTGRVRRRCDA